MSAEPTLSFVIPAYREAAHIGRTLRDLAQAMSGRYAYECIVVDHGSDDDTVAIAESEGARVVVRRGGTIASQRNLGVQHARGDILIFIDADVSLTPEWAAEFPDALDALRSDPSLITGSHCAPPRDGTWIERHWFAQIAREQGSRHLGTGHLIVTRSLFESIGGFDEHLSTGEDFDFCRRAVDAGGSVENRPELYVVHHDFPKSIAAFIRREAWHGSGGVATLRMAMRSKVVAGAAVFSALHLALIGGALVPGVRLVAVPAAAGGIVALCVVSTAAKFPGVPATTFAANTVVFYFYYLGRSIALARRLSRLSPRATPAA